MNPCLIFVFLTDVILRKKSRTDVTFKRHLSQGPCNGGESGTVSQCPGPEGARWTWGFQWAKTNQGARIKVFPGPGVPSHGSWSLQYEFQFVLNLFHFEKKEPDIRLMTFKGVCVLKWLLEELACKTRIRIEFTLFTLFSSLSFYFIS